MIICEILYFEFRLMMENFSWLTFMDAVPEKDEFLALKKELTKLRLEAKLRKSLSAAQIDRRYR